MTRCAGWRGSGSACMVAGLREPLSAARSVYAVPCAPAYELATDPTGPRQRPSQRSPRRPPSFFGCMYYAAMRPAEVITCRNPSATSPSQGGGC
jgi:hypothetical protein